jgi:hypothetical protein
VYLDHHWVIDVLAGWVTAVFAVLLADPLVDRLYGHSALSQASGDEPRPSVALRGHPFVGGTAPARRE